jgi:hypothetical protein
MKVCSSAEPESAAERVRRELEVRAIVRDVSLGGLEGGAEAAAYRANIDGMILWQPNFQFIWSPSNFDVRRSGWEVGATSPLGRLALTCADP